MERDGFVFYRSFSDAIRKIRKASDRLKAYEAIIDFGLDGKDPTDLSEGAEVAFIMARAQLEANNKRYLDGTKGGRPKKPVVIEEKTSGFENENQRIQVQKPKEKEKDKVKDKDKAKENDKDLSPISTDLASYIRGIEQKRKELAND